MHSTTKFLNGHSDGLGGALIGTRPEHKERFLLVQKAAGGIMSPFECFLVLRGIKTLPLRMKQHEENGRAVAEFLSTQPKLKRLAYPGLKSHPEHELAKKQQRGFGSMLSFDLGTREKAGRFLGAVKLFLNAESLGGVESLASHSATTTHAALCRRGTRIDRITEGLVRLSVGIEDKEDLIADLEQALRRVKREQGSRRSVKANRLCQGWGTEHRFTALRTQHLKPCRILVDRLQRHWPRAVHEKGQWHQSSSLATITQITST